MKNFANFLLFSLFIKIKETEWNSVNNSNNQAVIQINSSNSSLNSNTSSHQISYNPSEINHSISIKSRDLINQNQINNQISTNLLIHNNNNSNKLINQSHLITRDRQFITAQDNLGFITNKRNKHLNKLNDEKQLLEDMKLALNHSSNINDFENKLKRLRTASLSRSASKQQRFNRFAETMARGNQNHNLQFNNNKVLIQPSNEHIYESIENSHFLNNNPKPEYYFNSKLNMYTPQNQNESSLIQQVNDDDWSCSTMNSELIYDDKPLLLSGRNLHSANEKQLSYEGQLANMHNLKQLRENANQTKDDLLPDLLLKFKNESYS